MKISMLIANSMGYQEVADDIVELEKAGLDTVFVPESYGYDAATMMGYLAAKTEKVKIASGILPLYSRTPTLIAMTMTGLDNLSGGRAILGLGASGPQVIEGWHGVPYDAPMSRQVEIMEICRTIWRRERLNHDGPKYHMPLAEGEGTGLGRALKSHAMHVREDIPIVIASLGLKSVEMTAELADGWLPAFYVPGLADKHWGEALAAGTAKRDAAKPPLEVYAGGLVGIGEGLEPMRDLGRPTMALYVGGMGARGKNFYNDVFSSYGYEKEAEEIQDLFLAGKRAEAQAAIPASFIEKGSLVGPEGFVRDQVAKYRDSGVTTLSIGLVGETIADRVKTLDQLSNIIAKS